jgi:CHAT domain
MAIISPGSGVRDEIRQLVERLDARALIATYDVESDIPLRNSLDVGILQMNDAFRPQEASDIETLAVRVGAFWCEIVRCDVELDLRHGLAAIDDSRADAEILTQALLAREAQCSEFAAYAAARWNDGAGKLLYRAGSHARGRMRFTQACALADTRGLWWCRPDMHSNLLRARLEEPRQAAGDPLAPRLTSVVDQLTDLERRCADAGRKRGIPLDSTSRPQQLRDVEFLRGYSSVLHNLSFALIGEPARSLETSQRASAISAVLGDGYRESQAINHQARLISLKHDELRRDVREAVELYSKVLRSPWIRGQHIARQNLAILDGTITGAHELRDLLDSLDAESSARGGSAGLDIDLRFFTVNAYLKLAGELAKTDPGPAVADLVTDAENHELALARSVRQVIALPAYKRAYSKAMRPAYRRQIKRELSGPEADGGAERALSLVEEFSGRELLDLMASSDLPLLTPPKPADADDRPAPAPPADLGLAAPTAGKPLTSGRQDRRRRAGLRSAISEEELQADLQALLEREREFEDQFLQRPLDAAPADREIAAKAEMFVLNYPGTCIVRYFTYDLEKPEKPEELEGLGAFVIRDGRIRVIPCGGYAPVTRLVASLLDVDVPEEEHSRKIWELLVAPVWPEITRRDSLDHLVIIPADDLFSVPFQIASKNGYGWRSKPLGALVPLSQSVSLTAFISRGRHLLRRQYVSPDDDLCALVVRDDDVSGDELVMAKWQPEHLRLAGTPPKGLTGSYRRFPADWAGLDALAEVEPEFFVYAGHGRYVPGYGELGPFLRMGEAGRLTAYDVALRLRLPRNRLTILGACLAGQGAQTGAGDVAGFLRAFIAAGAGAITMPLWNVDDAAMATTAGTLLAQSRVAARSRRAFDVVQTLHDHYRSKTSGQWIEDMPVVLYT